MTEPVTASDMQLLQGIRAKADELAKLVQQANAGGFNVTFNMNSATGTCDVFDVFKMVKVDLRSVSN